MTLSLNDDLDEMLEIDDHGVSVVYLGNCFHAISNQEFTEAEDMEDSDERESTILYTKTSNVSSALVGHQMTVDGVSLYVRGNHPDGTGVSVLILSDTL